MNVMRGIKPKGDGKGRGVGRVDRTQVYTKSPFVPEHHGESLEVGSVAMSSQNGGKNLLTPATFPVF